MKEGHDIEIDRRRIDIKTPIKTAGEHEVSVAIYRDIKSDLTVVVGDEATLAEPEAEEAPAAEEAEATEEAAADAE